jgi:hypothetical protein
MTQTPRSPTRPRDELASYRSAAAATLLIALAVAGCSPSSPTDAACRAPLPNWARPQDGIPHLAAVNRITLGPRNELRWNGVTITETQLQTYLRQVRGAATLPFTIFEPDPAADCATAQRIRQRIDTGLGCTPGRCGEGGNWGHESGIIVAPQPR